MNLYARREPTTDTVTLKYVPERQRKRESQWLDVVLYADPEGRRSVARYPNYYSNKPRRGTRHVMHNCARYQLSWLPDIRE